jgi:hypothetical protein
MPGNVSSQLLPCPDRYRNVNLRERQGAGLDAGLLSGEDHFIEEKA